MVTPTLVLATAWPWIAVGGLAVLFAAAVAAGFLLLAMGRLSLDLGWGRSLHPLGPIGLRIAAPAELVFEILEAPYVGRAPTGSEIEVIGRGDGLVVAAHHTKVHFYTARTVEAVELEPPRRIGFKHLAGPVPHAVEEFRLEEVDGETELRYQGELGIDFFILGRVAGRRWVRPQWEGTVREHLDRVKRSAEERAAARRARQERASSP